MNILKRITAFFLALLLCVPPAWASPNATFTADTTTQYRNPERGWHFQSGALDDCNGIDLPNWDADAAGLPTPISPTPTIALLRTDLGTGVPSGGTLSTWSSCFSTIRSAGAMVILRFLSTGTAAQMVAQANAIAATLKANQDIIISVQVGFRCDFGEWATSCTDNNDVTDKTNVFNAVAAMTPTGIPLEFTQVFPRETWFGGTTPPTKADMLKGSVFGRTGAHSDCFLTGNGDSFFYTYVGTITGFSSTMTASQQAAYMQEASKYTMFGGETCSDSSGASAEMRTACTGSTDAQGLSGGILNEGPRYHVTHLNVSYAPNFLSAWSSGGCLATVTRLMGYRFQYDDITHPTSATRGTTITFDVNMRNVGWARIYSQRRLNVQLVNGGTTISCFSATQLRELDPQATSSTLVRVKCAIPGGTATGSYAVHLKMPSAFSTTQANAFTIRPANANSGGQTWDSTNYRWTTGTTVTVS